MLSSCRLGYRDIIDPGELCQYLTIQNVSAQPVLITIDGKRIEIEAGAVVNERRPEVIECHSQANDLRWQRVMTGPSSTIFVFNADKQDHMEAAFVSRSLDFKWLCGLGADRLDDIAHLEIDEDIESAVFTDQLVEGLLPDIASQVDLLADHWPETKRRIDEGPSKQTIPHRFHYVWIAKTPGGMAQKLSASHVTRLKTWLEKNGGAFEYWIWTDAPDGDAIGLTELLEYARAVGCERSVHIKSVSEALKDARHHFEEWESGALLDAAASIPFAAEDLMAVVEQYIACLNVGARSDVLKFLILYTYGGVYLDINDTECIKQFSPLIAPFDFIACMEPHGFINTAMAAASQYSRVLLSYICNLWIQRDYVYAMDLQSRRYTKLLDSGHLDAATQQRVRNAIDVLVVRRTGPVAFSKAVLGSLMNPIDNEEICVLPSSYWYPGWGLMTRYGKHDWLKPESYANHYDERAYVGSAVAAADADPRVALGEIAGSSGCGIDNHLC